VTNPVKKEGHDLEKAFRFDQGPTGGNKGREGSSLKGGDFRSSDRKKTASRKEKNPRSGMRNFLGGDRKESRVHRSIRMGLAGIHHTFLGGV